MGDMMKHLVDIYHERCIGCTRCMRACPTEAIRIIDDKANLIKDRCIYCGNCIINCHKNAYKVYSDSFANLNKFAVNVVILPLAVYGMVESKEELGGIYKNLLNYGFDEVFELSGICQLLSEKIINYISTENKPYVLTHCPTIVRLIQLKYPSLMEHLLPFDYPFEIAAKLLRKMMSEKYNISSEKIGISYLSECLSNFIVIKEELEQKQSNIDNVFLFNDLMKNAIEKTKLNVKISKSGVQFAQVGVYQKLTANTNVLTVDGIKQVSEIFECLYLNRLKNVKLIEAYSCRGGCLGGTFTIENPFISHWKVNQLSEQLRNKVDNEYISKILNNEDILSRERNIPLSPYKLGDDIKQSLNKMKKINQILEQLPNIDCCACGSPSCRALAEDIVENMKTLDDCKLLRKER